MIDLFYWTTPNGHKITIFLEEVELPYTIKPVNISKGEQFSAKFLAISPNGRIPAIVDRGRRGDPISVFESGAIRARPAVERAYAKAAQINTAPTVTDASKAILFGQGRTPGTVASPQRTSST